MIQNQHKELHIGNVLSFPHHISQYLVLASGEANKKMMDELDRLKQEQTQAKKSTQSSFQTPPPTVSGPTPNGKVAANARSASSASQPPALANPQGAAPGAASALPSTEGARLARLRRMCEIKPSGKCHVPPEVHQRWKKANHTERLKLADELEAANWAKDCLIFTIYLNKQ